MGLQNQPLLWRGLGLWLTEAATRPCVFGICSLGQFWSMMGRASMMIALFMSMLSMMRRGQSEGRLGLFWGAMVAVCWISGLTSSGSIVGEIFFGGGLPCFVVTPLFSVRRMPWFVFGTERLYSCIACWEVTKVLWMPWDYREAKWYA